MLHDLTTTAGSTIDWCEAPVAVTVCNAPCVCNTISITRCNHYLAAHTKGDLLSLLGPVCGHFNQDINPVDMVSYDTSLSLGFSSIIQNTARITNFSSFERNP